MKKVIIVLSAIALIASGCNIVKQKKPITMNEDENVIEGYVVRPIDGGIEYTKDNIIYIFNDGALTSIEVLNWGNQDGMPLSYAYICENTPKKIMYATESGDKSQSETHIAITLEKTDYYHKHNSKEGRQIKKHITSTPVDIWIELSQAFNWSEFIGLKSGASEIEHDGMDRTISVETQSGTFFVTNYSGNGLEKFFKIISNYENTLYEHN
jgi:hypothetical protein